MGFKKITLAAIHIENKVERNEVEAPTLILMHRKYSEGINKSFNGGYFWMTRHFSSILKNI